MLYQPFSNLARKLAGLLLVGLMLAVSSTQVMAALTDQDIQSFSKSLDGLTPLAKTHQSALLALLPKDGSIPTTAQLGGYIKTLGIEPEVLQVISQHGFRDIPTWLNKGQNIANAWIGYSLNEEQLNAFLAPYIEEYTQKSELTAQQQARMDDMIRSGTRLFASFQANNPDVEAVKRNQALIEQTIQKFKQLAR